MILRAFPCKISASPVCTYKLVYVTKSRRLDTHTGRRLSVMDPAVNELTRDGIVPLVADVTDDGSAEDPHRSLHR